MISTSKLNDLIKRRFACVGSRFCDAPNDKDTGHALGCPAAYRYRAELVIKDYQKARGKR